ncbi:hypothetical protein GWN42_01745 [candidate division KSB1 bacterium]|nr:hypothetical protein [candidate division KSB1 bacterium]NIS22548.1 hypothetical protein [candidate division KSB1 bacterium]NIU23045.1 hypothetical protein [candidate division KSB1 bacterium]NIU89173.1 hypothetical protein [candidate division KSB1 bacterium]NIV91538.1 hypothetical protein [candidate division KSB1 bacterium]
MKTGSFDTKVRLQIYQHFVETGHTPTMSEIANVLACKLKDVQTAYRGLAEKRCLVLQANDEILMAEPFSAVPTPFQVQVGDRSWWANCIWDALGIPAMLKQDARIVTACGDCNESMHVFVKDGQLHESSGVVHILVPAKHWWDDIVFA